MRQNRRNTLHNRAGVLFYSVLLVSLFSCQPKINNNQAAGYFEADEVIVSALQTGQLLSFTVKEGDTLQKGMAVGQIDVAGITLQKEQVEASVKALHQKTVDPVPELELVKKQLAVQVTQLEYQLKEQHRINNLVKDNAATQKQLDDINAVVDQLKKQIDVTRQQIAVRENNIANQNRAVLSEKAPLEKSIAQYQDQIRKGLIINPVTGTVLTRYSLEGEMAVAGKALYKIANLDTLTLRAYITGVQLALVKPGQPVEVRIDSAIKGSSVYKGTVFWVSDKSEFTPKNVQTRDERANLVYAVKIRVKNDGYLKIGMYADVLLNNSK